MGFFADVGPLTVFVSHQLIHPDLKFDPNSNPPSFASDEQVREHSGLFKTATEKTFRSLRKIPRYD